ILPVFLIAVTVVPSLLLAKAETRQRVVVVDSTGQAASELQAALAAPESKAPPTPRRGDRGDRGHTTFAPTVEPPGPDPAKQREDLDVRVRTGKIDAWIWVDPVGLAANKVEYHARNVSNFVTQEALRDKLSAAIRRVRLRQAGLDTVKIGKEGSRAEEGMAGFAFAYLLFMLLYMVIAIWGQQVMTGVLEEKGTRIVEVLVASVRPFDLLMGKLVGICCLGLTQIAIWFATLIALTAPGVVAAIAFLPAGMHLPTVTFTLAINFAIFFIL